MEPKAKRSLDGHVSFHCPGCDLTHSVPTTGDIAWGFNDNLVKPTISPSILLHPHPGQPRCHSFVRDGRIMFLVDSSHPLSGQTVDLPNWK